MHSFYSNNLFQYFVDLRQIYNAHERCIMTSEVNKSSKAKKRKTTQAATYSLKGQWTH